MYTHMTTHTHTSATPKSNWCLHGYGSRGPRSHGEAGEAGPGEQTGGTRFGALAAGIALHIAHIAIITPGSQQHREGEAG